MLIYKRLAVHCLNICLIKLSASTDQKVEMNHDVNRATELRRFSQETLVKVKNSEYVHSKAFDKEFIYKINVT